MNWDAQGYFWDISGLYWDQGINTNPNPSINTLNTNSFTEYVLGNTNK